jgi:hypothetical protein
MDLGSVHKLTGDVTSGTGPALAALCVYWAASKKGIMSRKGSESIRVLINHWRWLRDNGYKKEAASCKLQAASLTRKNYRIIKEVERRNYD